MVCGHHRSEMREMGASHLLPGRPRAINPKHFVLSSSTHLFSLTTREDSTMLIYTRYSLTRSVGEAECVDRLETESMTHQPVGRRVQTHPAIDPIEFQ